MTQDISHYDETVYNEPYIVKDGCLYEQVSVKDQLVDVKFADFVPILKAEITHDDGVEQRKLFRIAATHKTGMTLSEQTVSADEMQSMKWLLQRWGQYGAVVPKQNVLAKICHAIMQTKQDVKQEVVYAQTGWRKIGSEWVFLMPQENSKHTVELQGKLKIYRFTQPCDKESLFYLAAMLDDSFAPQNVMLPLLSVTFLSPLNHFLKTAGCEPKFVTALIGKTGSRKSTLAALFLSFFGRFTASDLPMSFHDTANSILSNVYYLKDVLTCIDDFHPSGMFHEQEMRTIAQNISHYYGDRIGRARLNTKAELQASRPPTGNAIITAEYAPEISMSGSARYFNIELNENDVKLNDLSFYQRLAEQNVLSGTMMCYVDWLKREYLSGEDKFAGTLSNLFLSYRSEFISKLAAANIKFHNRTPDMLAHLKIGMEFLLRFLLIQEQLGQDDVKTYASKFDEILLQSGSLNAEVIVNENPTTRFCEKLKSLLDSGRCYVELRGTEYVPTQKGYLGMEDNGCYYLLADAAHSEVRKLCAEQGEHFSVSKNQLIKQLAEDGILIKSGGRNTTTVRSNGGKMISVAVLDKAKMEQRMSGDLCPPSAEVG